MLASAFALCFSALRGIVLSKGEEEVFRPRHPALENGHQLASAGDNSEEVIKVAARRAHAPGVRMESHVQTVPLASEKFLGSALGDGCCHRLRVVVEPGRRLACKTF